MMPEIIHIIVTLLFAFVLLSLLSILVGRFLGARQRKEDELHAAFREDQGNLNGRNLP